MPRGKVTHCPVHYKQMREVGASIMGKNIHDAIKYLNRVLEKQAGIPALVHTGGVGHHSVGKLVKAPGNAVMFPTKAVKAMLWILNNVLAGKTCEKFTDSQKESLTLVHVQVNRAPKSRRRTYRAHGRITAYMRSPCHVEVIAKPADMTVPSEATKEEKAAAPQRLTRKSMARLRVRLANGASA
jgi:large subunit ribosomal protein L17e